MKIQTRDMDLKSIVRKDVPVRVRPQVLVVVMRFVKILT